MIPTLWPDFTLAVMTYLKQTMPDVVVTRTKRGDASQQVVVAVEPQQLETPVSRRVAVLLEAWAENDDGVSVVGEAVALMSEAMYALQRAPDMMPKVVRFDQPVGPSIEKDDAKFEYAEGSVVLVFSR